MKKLGKLKLNQISKVELEKRELNILKGGVLCACACAGSNCSCAYAGIQDGPDDSYYGGSSDSDNSAANNPNDGTNDNAQANNQGI